MAMVVSNVQASITGQNGAKLIKIYRDYILNPDKTLLKKLNAAKRQQIEYTHTGGDLNNRLKSNYGCSYI